jgi:hypothetical protein
MILENKRKTLIDIDLTTWAKVRYFATIKELSINEAVEILLTKGLSTYGHKKEMRIPDGESLAASSQQVVEEAQL